MKTALVITDGLRQIALTPETDDERNILATLTNGNWDLQIKSGQFFICAGGYGRFGIDENRAQPDSAMLVLRPRAAKVVDTEPIHRVPRETM